LPVKDVKKAADLPFFLVIDDRVSFSYIFTAAQPGAWSLNPNDTVNAKETKQVYSFTHFDAWAYGTNFLTISLYKSDKNESAAPCTSTGAITSGPRGSDTNPLPVNPANNVFATKVEFNSEPIRLTFNAFKAFWVRSTRTSSMSGLLIATDRTSSASTVTRPLWPARPTSAA
jgi:hypothetical protein